MTFQVWACALPERVVTLVLLDEFGRKVTPCSWEYYGQLWNYLLSAL